MNLRTPKVFTTIFFLTNCLALSLPSVVNGQAKPEIKSKSSNYVPTGKTTRLSIYGENLSPTAAKTNRPPIGVKVTELKATEGADKSKGSKQLTLEINVPPDCPTDNFEITLEQSSGDGKSPITIPLSIVDGTETEVPAKLPNTSFKDAMSLPSTEGVPSIALTGNVEGDSPATFRFDGKQGQIWHFRVFAGRGGSTLDPVLRIRDSKHRSLALSASYPKADLVLDFQVPTTGLYYVELMDEQSRGGAALQYRLSVHPGKSK